ncbi:MAG: antitoxin family protein [Anaerolineae bacterium]
MTEIVTAVYERGVLRPLHPIDLHEHQTVRLQVLPEAGDDVESVIEALVQAGLLTPPLGRSEVPSPSAEERRELAERLGQVRGKPLSEVIIEERGEW